MVENKEGVIETPEENVENNTKGGEALSAKDQWLANVRGKYGDDLSEDELYTKVGADFDAEKSYASGARDERKKLQEAIDSNPEIAAFMQKVADGASVSEAAKDIPEDMPQSDAENMAAMEAEARRRGEAAMESMNKLNANLNSSKDAMERYFKENNIGKEEADELTNAFMQKIAQPISEGLVTDEAMTIIAKGLCYDSHRLKWEEAGRIAGRNDKIEEEKKKFEAGKDGLPSGQANSGMQKETVVDRDGDWINSLVERTKPHPFFDRGN